MQEFEIMKLGCNVQVLNYDSISNTYNTYQCDSANFECIYVANKVTINLLGVTTFTTMDITNNNVLYINSGTGDILINSLSNFRTNYELLFKC
jgi:hypothetical protein